MGFEDEENPKFRKLFGLKYKKNEQSGYYDLTTDVTYERLYGYSKEDIVENYSTESLSQNLSKTTMQLQSNNNTLDNNFYPNAQAPTSPFLTTFLTNAYNQEKYPLSIEDIRQDVRNEKLSPEQKRYLNFYEQKKNIDVEAYNKRYAEKKDIDFFDDYRRGKLKKQSDIEVTENETSNVIPNNIGKNFYFKLEEKYIEEYRLIRLSVDGIFEIYRWNETTKRYMKIDTNKTLATDINSYAYQAYGNNIEINQSQIDVMVNRMRHSTTVPLLENSAFASESYEKQLFFLNGYYDFRDNRFYEEDTSQWFHTFTIPCEYDENASNPVTFDEMLRRIFDDDKTKIKLTYQIIGAILSNVSLKYIYVFQGVSHGGKSTLAECIVRLLNEDEVKFMGSMNELDENKARTFERRIKLLSIDDAPSDKWNSSTISYLKTRSRGISRKNRITFKILLNTNYSIDFKTENGRDESMENRILTLPFEKNMQEASEREYNSDEERKRTEKIKNYLEVGFEEEKTGIIRKAIKEFQEVLSNDNKFIYQYPLNEAINNSQSNTLLTNSKDHRKQKIKELLQSNLEITYSEEEYINANDIFNYVNQEINEGQLSSYRFVPFDRSHEIGKILKSIWGEDINDKRRNDKIFYKLKFKN